jgi:hypothetical protein
MLERGECCIHGLIDHHFALQIAEELVQGRLVTMLKHVVGVDLAMIAQPQIDVDIVHLEKWLTVRGLSPTQVVL